MFLDETAIKVISGKGGDGCVSFLRRKNLPRGGPDGGDGSDGGDVILVADKGVIDLFEISRKTVYKAQKGQPGGPNFISGNKGENLVIKVPIGTVVKEEQTKEILFDFVEHGDEWIACLGGKGGRGNNSYKSSVNQIPREFQFGEEGEEKTLFLELRVIADVGLVGLPNAGKSTFLSAVTAARPKVANFPFTTMNPHLGVVNAKGAARFIIADLPGLIEGSADGKGLGVRFLKHIQRTRVILHLVDVFPDNGKEPYENYQMIRKELENYDKALAQKPEIIVMTKSDESGSELAQEEFEKITGKNTHLISSLFEEGLEGLLQMLAKILQENQA